jgi:hypothetical protein
MYPWQIPRDTFHVAGIVVNSARSGEAGFRSARQWVGCIRLGKARAVLVLVEAEVHSQLQQHQHD